MYQYTLPKSSVWGVAIKSKPASELREAVGHVLGQLTDKHQSTGGSVFWNPPGTLIEPGVVPHSTLAELADQIGLSSVREHVPVSIEQVELCYEIMLKHPTYWQAGMVLMENLKVFRWRGEEGETESAVWIQYGRCSRVSLFLRFQAEHTFYRLQQAFADILQTKLNEAYLKLVGK